MADLSQYTTAQLENALIQYNAVMVERNSPTASSISDPAFQASAARVLGSASVVITPTEAVIASSQTAGDKAAGAVPPVTSPPAEAQVENVKVAGGSMQYVVGGGGTRTILLYDDSGKLLGAGTDIADATAKAVGQGATAAQMTAFNAEYSANGEATVARLSDVTDPAALVLAQAQSQNVGSSSEPYPDSSSRLAAAAIERAKAEAVITGNPLNTEFKGEIPKPKIMEDSGITTKANAQVTANGGTSNRPVLNKPTANPLHEYVTYTYGLSLHVLSDSEYASLLKSPGTKFVPKTTIISSANKYSKPQPAGPRDPAFTDDFYFDDFKMETVIGLNHETRGGNTVSLSFTIIEPYGMTLLNRMLDLAVRLNKPNYLDIPYCLEINFYGTDDTGKFTNLDAHTKLIPLRLITSKIRATVKGSEYQITAIPYCKIGNLQSLQATKANFEISSRTLGEYFSNRGTGFAATQTAVTDTQREQKAQADANTRFMEATKGSGITTGAATKPPTATVKSSSFADAFNEWQAQEVTHGYMLIGDEVVFDIDSEISKATIVDPTTINPKKSTSNTPNGTNGVKDKSNLAAGNPKPAGGDFTQSFFNINAGTSISTVLNNMIMNSTFITDQLTNSETKEKPTINGLTADRLSTASGKDVRWFKISNKVELLGYDKNRGYYAKRITYYVRPYTHYNASSPDAPISRPTSAVKEYNYIYTGKNTDIMDFTIEFNHLFNTNSVVDRSKMAAINTNTAGGSVNNTAAKATPVAGFTITPTQKIYLSSTQSSITGGSEDTSVKQQAAVLADNIYQNAAGDMLTLTLKILGDPQFIKQDEILYTPDTVQDSSQFVGKSGSLSMDNGEIFCKVTFKTPVDIDEKTGLLLKDKVWNDTYFSGYFKVQKVSSEFRKGVFTQELMLIRHRDQEGDSKGTVNSAGKDSASQRVNPDPTDKTSSSRVTGEKAPGVDFISVGDDGSISITYANGDIASKDIDGNVIERKKADLDRPGKIPPPSTAAYTSNTGTEQFPEGVVRTSSATGASTVVATNAGGAATNVFRAPSQDSLVPGSVKAIAKQKASVPIGTNSTPDGSSIVGTVGTF